MIRVLVLTISIVLVASSYGSDWTEDYSEALSNARCEGRPMLVVLENQEKAVQRAGSIFHVERELLTQFEICRVDVASEYGKKVAEQFSPSELPYTVITDSDCKQIVFRGVGERSINQWKETLQVHAEPEGGADDDLSESGSGDRKVAKPAKSAVAAKPGLFKQTDLESARALATENGRRLVVFVSMNNCVFCDKMHAETFSDGSVIGSLSRSEFETVAIKRESHPAFVAEHDIKIYPTTLVFSDDGKLLAKIDGFVAAPDFLARINVGR